MDPRLLASLTGVPQALTLLIAVLALRRALDPALAPTSSPAVVRESYVLG
jgi:hypothetical protein